MCPLRPPRPRVWPSAPPHRLFRTSSQPQPRAPRVCRGLDGRVGVGVCPLRLWARWRRPELCRDDRPADGVGEQPLAFSRPWSRADPTPTPTPCAQRIAPRQEARDGAAERRIWLWPASRAVCSDVGPSIGRFPALFAQVELPSCSAVCNVEQREFLLAGRKRDPVLSVFWEWWGLMWWGWWWWGWRW